MSAPDTTETQTLFPPKFVFQDEGVYVGSPDSNPVSKTPQPIALGVEFPKEGGILLHLENQKYPKKGWPFKNAMNAIDAVKRAFLCAIKFTLKLPKNIITGKVVNSAMEQIADFSCLVFKTHGVFWKPNYYCTMVREIHHVGLDMIGGEKECDEMFNEFTKAGGSDTLSVKDVQDILFVKMLCTVLEFDDAYRYALQDGLGVMNVEAFTKNPSKEARRVMKVIASRGSGTKDKFDNLGNVLWLILWIPSIRRNAREFFSKVDMEKLYMDESDWYQCLVWNGYNFGGYPLSARLILREEIDEKWLKEGGNHIDTEGNVITIPPHEQT